jgi:hypothetical protein
MVKRQTAQQRYQQQVARRAQPVKSYEVTIICEELNQEQTVRVPAVDMWLAQTQAMLHCTIPLKGEHVDFTITEVNES